MNLGSAGRLPEAVATVIDTYTRLVDRALPGRISALYLVGSLALGDYQDGSSDIDFLAVSSSPLSDRELDAVERVHEDLRASTSRPHFSGIYLSEGELGRDPLSLAAVPSYFEGEFQRSGTFEANPSVWETVRRYPLAVRGLACPAVRRDAESLRRWNLDNLNTYWQGQIDRGLERLKTCPVVLPDDIVLWSVSGVLRLRYTIATGDITSKTGACEYGLRTLDKRWHRLLGDALAIRRGMAPSSRRVDRGEDVVDFMRFVIEDTNRLSPAKRGSTSAGPT